MEQGDKAKGVGQGVPGRCKLTYIPLRKTKLRSLLRNSGSVTASITKPD